MSTWEDNGVFGPKVMILVRNRWVLMGGMDWDQDDRSV